MRLEVKDTESSGKADRGWLTEASSKGLRLPGLSSSQVGVGEQERGEPVWAWSLPLPHPAVPNLVAQGAQHSIRSPMLVTGDSTA